jgi:hypothetical protein
METNKSRFRRTVRIVQASIELEGDQHKCQIMIDNEGKLVGVAGLDVLRRWLETQTDTDPKDLSTIALTATPTSARIQLSEAAKKNIKFFGHGPCWFEGCEQLRAEYQNELTAMQARAEGCRGCEKGVLMRKYLELVEAATNEKPAENPNPA